MSFQNDIDWSWNNFDPPAKIECLAYPVNIDPPVLRGNKSAHECVTEAIRSARSGDRQKALNWLKASQCHNDDARDGIHAAGNAAIDYAVDTYKSYVP
ncbi:hypothetical protein U8607_15940 [Methylobacterium durans]|uniref:hypothetical protein n=1 Tax=Methylobacterium durans TaxID=2202825 RepID=UPI002AFEE903|nr:hypothetical protein [Methylobacterium durans]MEA1833576.1 hypothetical protein [Methylobacterium durans]